MRSMPVPRLVHSLSAGLAALALVGATVPGAVAADRALVVPAAVAEAQAPPPVARACAVEFDGYTLVVSTCPRECYREAWDGPILRTVNACPQSIWVTYQHEDEAGRSWQSACYRIPGRSQRAVPEPNLWLFGHRQVLVSTVPGEGYPVDGFQARCTDVATELERPIWWLSHRHWATVLKGPLGDDAVRP